MKLFLLLMMFSVSQNLLCAEFKKEGKIEVLLEGRYAISTYKFTQNKVSFILVLKKDLQSSNFTTKISTLPFKFGAKIPKLKKKELLKIIQSVLLEIP